MDPRSSSGAPEKSPMLGQFVSQAEFFFVCIREMFWECPGVKSELLKFHTFIRPPTGKFVPDENGDHVWEALEPHEIQVETPLHLQNQERMIRECHGIFEAHKAAIDNKDMDALREADISWINGLGIADKVDDPDFDEECVAAFWDHIYNMRNTARMYCSVPAGMMTKIEGCATALAAKLQNGEMSFANMNIMQIGQDILGDMEEADIEEFMANAPNVFAGINGMKSMMGEQGLGNMDSLMGALGSMGGAGAGAGGMDPAQLMSMASVMMGSMGAGGAGGAPSLDGLGSLMSALGGPGAGAASRAAPGGLRALQPTQDMAPGGKD